MPVMSSERYVDDFKIRAFLLAVEMAALNGQEFRTLPSKWMDKYVEAAQNALLAVGCKP